MDLERVRSALDGAVERLDDAVPVAADVENEVLVDRTWPARWAGPLFLTLSVLLLPWTVVLAAVLPGSLTVVRYDVAWVGFDVALLAALLATGWCALRRSRVLAPAAAASGTLLVVDAWFDVVTTPGGGGLVVALLMALLVELPLAAVCFWLGHHAVDVSTRRLRVALHRPLPVQGPVQGPAQGPVQGPGRAGQRTGT